MAALIFVFLMICYYILFQRIRSFHKQTLTPLSGTTILVTVIGTQIYDKLVLSIGVVLGEGPLLQVLSIPRFLFSAIFIPLLLVTAMEYVSRTGVNWAENNLAKGIAWLLAAILIGYEFIGGQMTHSLTPEVVEGVLRYSPSEGGAALSVLVVVGGFTLTGLFLLGKVRWPWTALTGAFFLAALVFPKVPYATFVIAGSEVAFFWSLVATENRVLSKPYELEDDELVKRLPGQEAPNEK